MASITRFPGVRHLRSEPSFHLLYYAGGKLKRSGRGLAFWFMPLSASIAEIPCDDRDETFLFHSRSSDFQDVVAQGVITYRVADPATLAERIDFSVDLVTGNYKKKPLEQLSQLLVQAAQQHAWAYLASTPVLSLLAEGVEKIRDRISAGLANDSKLREMGIEIVTVRVSSLAPTAELEKALQAPTNEAIQQDADEAMYQRRALAVEKERAIQENELQNRIELARREEELIARQGHNERKRAAEEAEALEIASRAEAERQRTGAEAEADSIQKIEGARVGAESKRIKIYRSLPSSVLVGLAARELAGKLERIEHLNVTPELLSPLLSNLIRAGTRSLEGSSSAGEAN